MDIISRLGSAWDGENKEEKIDMKKKASREHRKLVIALVLATVTMITLNAQAALAASHLKRHAPICGRCVLTPM